MRGLKAKRLRKAAKKYTPYSPWVQYEPQQFNTKVFSEWVTDPDTGAMTLEKKEVLITKTIRMSKFCGRSLYKELKTHSKMNIKYITEEPNMRGYHNLETQFAIMKEHTDLENYLQTRYVYQSPDANQKIYNKALEDVAEEFGLDLGVDRNEN